MDNITTNKFYDDMENLNKGNMGVGNSTTAPVVPVNPFFNESPAQGPMMSTYKAPDIMMPQKTEEPLVPETNMAPPPPLDPKAQAPVELAPKPEPYAPPKMQGDVEDIPKVEKVPQKDRSGIIQTSFQKDLTSAPSMFTELQLAETPEGKAFLDVYNGADDSGKRRLLAEPAVADALSRMYFEKEKDILKDYTKGGLDDEAIDKLVRNAWNKGGVVNAFKLAETPLESNEFTSEGAGNIRDVHASKDGDRTVAPVVVDAYNIADRATLKASDVAKGLPEDVRKKNQSEYRNEVQPIFEQAINNTLAKDTDLQANLALYGIDVRQDNIHSGAYVMRKTKLGYGDVKDASGAPSPAFKSAADSLASTIGVGSLEELQSFLEATKKQEGGIYLTPYALGVGSSGVTVGGGIDLGWQEVDQIYKYTEGLSPADREAVTLKLAPFTAFGSGQALTKNSATHALVNVSKEGSYPILTPEQATVLTYNKTKDIVKTAFGTVPEADLANIPLKVKQAFLDMAFQHGEYGARSVATKVNNIVKNPDLTSAQKNAQIKEAIYNKSTSSDRKLVRENLIDAAYPVSVTQK